MMNFHAVVVAKKIASVANAAGFGCLRRKDDSAKKQGA
jgi:hypothetical protein